MRQFQIYLEMYCLDPSTLWSVYQKMLPSFVAIGQFSSKWPRSSSCTVKPKEWHLICILVVVRNPSTSFMGNCHEGRNH